MRVGFVGLGKLGLPVAVTIASKGHTCLGYDVHPSINSKSDTADLLNRTVEAGPSGSPDTTITSMLPVPLRIVDEVDELVAGCDIIFLGVQTPHQEEYEGKTRLPETRVDFDYTFLVQASTNLSNAIAKQDENKVVILLSTVLPGTFRREILPVISPKMQICYNPFFIAMGTVVRDFLQPEFILFGYHSDSALQKAKELYQTITEAPMYETTIENAEMIKVSYNTMIGLKIAYANTIMELCDKMPNTNCDAVMEGLAYADRRLISTAYLRGGMGDGGGCHPRDNIALSWLSNEKSLSFNFYDSIMTCREKQTEYLGTVGRQYAKDKSLPIVILGKSFKPETNLTAGSPAVLLKHIIEEDSNFKNVVAFDPFSDSEDERAAALSKPAVFIIGTRHLCFADYAYPAGSVVVDPHRFIPPQEGVHVHHVGIGDHPQEQPPLYKLQGKREFHGVQRPPTKDM